MIACNRLLKDLDEWQVNPPFGSSKRSPIISKGGFNIFAPTALSSLFFFLFLISPRFLCFKMDYWSEQSPRDTLCHRIIPTSSRFPRALSHGSTPHDTSPVFLNFLKCFFLFWFLDFDFILDSFTLFLLFVFAVLLLFGVLNLGFFVIFSRHRELNNFLCLLSYLGMRWFSFK